LIMLEILITGLDERLAGPLAAALEMQSYAVREERWEDAVLDSIERIPFRAVVSRYPLPGAGFGILLSAVRSRASASRNAGLMLVAPSSELEAARGLIGRGVNRVVCETDALETTLMALHELLTAPPRVPFVAPARISLEFGGEAVSVLCQTENLSTSGMLVRGCTNCRPGMRVAFQLQLGAEEEPLEGLAEIARTTNPEREGLRGFGARFVSLSEADRERLQTWLERASEPIAS